MSTAGICTSTPRATDPQEQQEDVADIISDPLWPIFCVIAGIAERVSRRTAEERREEAA